MKHEVFISYSSKNKDTVYSLRSILEANGISCWIAPDSIPAGDDYASCIHDAIHGCSVFLLMLSEAAQESLFVRKEIDLAFNARKKVIPFMLENCKLNKAYTFLLSETQRLEAYRDLEKCIGELITDICGILGKELPAGLKPEETTVQEQELPAGPRPAPKPVRAYEPYVPAAEVEWEEKEEWDPRLPPAPCFDYLPEHIWAFTDPLTKKMGLVDSRARILVQAEWDELICYGNECMARRNDKWACIRDGEVVIPPEYDYLSPFTNGRAFVENKGMHGVIDDQGKVIIPLIYSDMKGNYMPEDGDVDFFQQPPHGRGYYIVRKKTVRFLGRKEAYGIIDMDGKELVPPIYDRISAPRKNAMDLLLAKKNGKAGFIDHLGNVKIPFVWDNARRPAEAGSPIAVCRDGRWGFIDEEGNTVIPTVWDNAKQFRHGLAEVTHKGLIGFVDTKGALAIPLMYEDSYGGFGDEDYAIVRKDQKLGVIDRQGKVLLPFEFDMIQTNYAWKKTFIVRNFGRYGLYFTDGACIAPCVYEEISPVSEDVVKLKERGLYGLCDVRNRKSLPCVYTQLRPQMLPMAVVQQNGLWGVIGMNGRTLITSEWDAMGDFLPCGVTWAFRRDDLYLIDYCGMVLSVCR